MSSNKAMLTMIAEFHYSTAHMLMKPPQNMTQLDLGERGGVEFQELIDGLRMFHVLLLTNSFMKTAEVLAGTLCSAPAQRQEQHLHPGTILQWPQSGQCPKSQSAAVLLLFTQREKMPVTLVISKSLLLHWQEAVFLSAICSFLQDPVRSLHLQLKSKAGNAVFAILSNLSLCFLPIYASPCLIFL